MSDFAETYRPVTGLGMSSLVLGTVGLMLFFLPILGIPISVLGLACGLVGFGIALFRPRVSLRWGLGGIGMSALALASLALRGEFGGTHWSGWRGLLVESGRTENGAGSAASGQAAQSLSNGRLQNPWAGASRGSSGHRDKAAPATGGATVGPGLRSAAAAPNAARVGLGSAAGLTALAAKAPLRIGTSSTAESIATTIAQSFLRATRAAPPQVLVEPADQLIANLCAGAKLDAAVLSRRMTPAEAADCVRPGIGSAVVEVKLGFQAIVFVRSKLYGPLPLTARDLYLALSKTVPDPVNPTVKVPNRYQNWNDVDPALPLDRIQVFGPPLASEQGETLRALLESGCRTVLAQAASQNATSPAARAAGVDAPDADCVTVRDDGAYVDASADAPALLQQKLEMLPTAIGLYGFGFISNPFAGENLVASPIDDVEPTEQTIASGSYAGARPFYLYVNRDRARTTTGMFNFVEYCLGVANGAYTPAGIRILIPLSSSESAAVRANTSAALGYPTTGAR